MKKSDLTALKRALEKAENVEIAAQIAAQELCQRIVEITGVTGFVDHLQGDGFGFTPESNNDTHVPVEFIIDKLAADGECPEEWMLKNLSI